MSIEEETLELLQHLSDYLCNQNLINNYPELQDRFLIDLYAKFTKLIATLNNVRSEALSYKLDLERIKKAYTESQNIRKNIMTIIDEVLDDEDECYQDEVDKVSSLLKRNQHIIKTQQEEIIKLREKCKKTDSQKDTNESISEEFFNEIKEKAYNEITDTILKYPFNFKSFLNSSNIHEDIINYLDRTIAKIRDRSILDLHPELDPYRQLDSYIPISSVSTSTSSVNIPYNSTMSKYAITNTPWDEDGENDEI